MEPIIDHIEITVKDMSVAVPFYDKLLPLLGFDVHHLTAESFRGGHDQSQEARGATSSCIQSGISRRGRQAPF